jgi:hypothetical protein
MLKKWKTIITVTIILINTDLSFAQQLNGLSYNHAITKAISEGDKSYQKQIIAPITFGSGFFEDFSSYHYKMFPKNDHWIDRYAFINSTFADSMISLGVATLDAFDEKGYPYYSFDSASVISADVLTSQPFIFSETPKNRVYFSFFYQAGGKGDSPEGIINDIPDVEGKDSLLLEFYSVNDTNWNRVFYTLDNTDNHVFKQVVVPVDTSYLHNGFQFRFRNYVSMPTHYQEGEDFGKFTNADQWHVDYIQMREADSASMYVLNDITIAKPLMPTLIEYTSVPWTHFMLAQSSQGGMRREIPFSVWNFNPNNGAPVHFHRHFTVENMTIDDITSERDFENALAPFEFQTYLDNFSTGLNYVEEDSMAVIEITGYVQPDVEVIQPLMNDTVKRTEVYHDQYAYDDGTAEFGYGLNSDEEFARIAQRYNVYRRADDPDLLRGVLVYFCKSVDSATYDYSYSISIRKEDGDKPASQNLYTSDTLTPDYSANINQFTRIEIDPPLPLSEPFYVVINQISGYLNIGYDINEQHQQNIFVYTQQQWSTPYSIRPGSLMIRPSFGKYTMPTETPEPVQNTFTFTIYPNPVSDIINFKFAEDLQKTYKVQIFNIMGVQLINTEINELSLSVSILSPGVYFTVISTPDNRFRQTAKFIKE